MYYACLIQYNYMFDLKTDINYVLYFLNKRIITF